MGKYEDEGELMSYQTLSDTFKLMAFTQLFSLRPVNKRYSVNYHCKRVIACAGTFNEAAHTRYVDGLRHAWILTQTSRMNNDFSRCR